MNDVERYYATYTIADGRRLVASFAHINDRDGFEISLGMYRSNLGQVTEEVYMRYLEKFDGRVQSNQNEGDE